MQLVQPGTGQTAPRDVNHNPAVVHIARRESVVPIAARDAAMHGERLAFSPSDPQPPKSGGADAA